MKSTCCFIFKNVAKKISKTPTKSNCVYPCSCSQTSNTITGCQIWVRVSWSSVYHRRSRKYRQEDYCSLAAALAESDAKTGFFVPAPLCTHIVWLQLRLHSKQR